jgi:hypothetical protein
MKWELIKWYYRLRWVLVSAVVALIMFVILAALGSFNNSNLISKYILQGISGIYDALILFFCVILPSVNMLIDYILPHKYLEWTVKRKQGTVVLVKIIMNLILFYIGVLFVLALNYVFNTFILDGHLYFLATGDKGVDIALWLIFGVFIPMMILFFYMLTYYIKANTKHRIILMLIIMVVVLGCLYLLSKVKVMSRIFEFGTAIIFIIAASSLIQIIESKYEPK